MQHKTSIGEKILVVQWQESKLAWRKMAKVVRWLQPQDRAARVLQDFLLHQCLSYNLRLGVVLFADN